MGRIQTDSTKEKIRQKLKIDIDKDKLADLCNSGYTIKKIAMEFGVSRTTIQERLLEYGLETETQKKAKVKTGLCSCGKEFRQVESRKYCPSCKYLEIKNIRKKVKKILVDYKGGSCEHCGYNKCMEALEFHHKDPHEKDFAIGQSIRKIESMKLEVDKCLLLCANCHREEHVRLRGE